MTDTVSFSKGQIDEKIQELLGIAEFLKDEYQQNEIFNLKKIVADNRFCLAFLGQFAAGKSFLINSLLDRDILPVKEVESTSVVTFVRYGETEQVVFYHNDGRGEKKNFNALKGYFYQSENWNSGNDIDFIDVFIKHPLLSTGLILMDTPGMNTVTVRHEELTARAIGYAVYVMGGSMSGSDKDFIKCLNYHGLSLIFVRTRMDTIDTFEETLQGEETEKKEKSLIQSFLDCDIEFFPVSNIKESPWYQQIETLREYLKKKLINNLESLLAESVKRKMGLIIEKLKEKVSTLRESAFQIASKEEDAIEENRRIIERQKDEIEKHVDKKRDKINRELVESLAKVKNEVKSIVTAKYKQYSKNFPITQANDQSVLKEQLQTELENVAVALQEYVRSELDAILRETGNGIKDVAGSFSQESKDLSIDISDVIFDSYEDFISRVDFQDSSIDSEIETSKVAIEQLDQLMRQAQFRYEEEKNEYAVLRDKTKTSNEALGNFNNTDHGSMYIDIVDGPGKEEQFRTIGKVLDLATFFIPGKVVGMAAQKDLTAFGTVAEMSTDGMKTLAEIGKRAKDVAVMADRGKDLLYGGKLVNSVIMDKKGRNHQRGGLQSGGGILRFLDMLTFEHWFAEIGKGFEEPARKVFDTAKANQLAAEKYRLEQEYQANVKMELDKKRELGLLKDKQDEIEAKRLAEERHIQILGEKKKAEEKRIQEEIEQKFRLLLKERYCDEFHRQSILIEELLLNKFDIESKNIPEILLPYYTEALIQEVNRLKKRLDDFAGDKAKCTETVTECDRYITELNAIVV